MKRWREYAVIILVYSSTGCDGTSKTSIKDAVDSSVEDNLTGDALMDSGVLDVPADIAGGDGIQDDAQPGDTAGPDTVSDNDVSEIDDDLVPTGCGNSTIEPPEECDEGANNGKPGITCMSNCVLDSDLDGTADSEDCGPADPVRHPGAAEICNGLDDDCDQAVDDEDETVETKSRYLDCDGDGYATLGAVPIVSCESPNLPSVCTQGLFTDLEPEEAKPESFDCDDSRADISPAAPEVCDYVDNNCDGQIDLQAVDAPTWYSDCDGDGVAPLVGATPVTRCFSGPSQPWEICQTGGWTSLAPQQGEGLAWDCDDNDDQVNSLQVEYCDAQDNNCDQQVDEGSPNFNWYLDCDGDGYAVEEADSQPGCELPEASPICWSGTWTLKYPSGPQDSDCDDQDPLRHPGAAPKFSSNPNQTGLAAWDYDCSGSVEMTPSGECDDSGEPLCATAGANNNFCVSQLTGIRWLADVTKCYYELDPDVVCGTDVLIKAGCGMSMGVFCSVMPPITSKTVLCR